MPKSASERLFRRALGKRVADARDQGLHGPAPYLPPVRTLRPIKRVGKRTAVKTISAKRVQLAQAPPPAAIRMVNIARAIQGRIGAPPRVQPPTVRVPMPTSPGAPQAPPRHRDFVKTRNLQRRGVPNPQALRRDEYQQLYGTDRDVSPAQPQGGENILIGPTALNHEGRLRKTGRVCGHWAMYAYLVNVDGRPTLGVKFVNGFRCFYPGTSEVDYHAIVNAESGSYYVWDYLKKRSYTAF